MGQLAGLLEFHGTNTRSPVGTALGQSTAEVVRERQALLALPLTDAERRVLPLVQAAAYRTGVEPALIMAVISVESQFEPRAVNYAEPKGGPSVGLMQVQLPTARGELRRPQLTLEQLYDPALNLRAGTGYLLYQLKRYRWDPAAAVAGYNAGTAFRRKGGGYVNQRHVDKVLGRLAHYRGAGLPPAPVTIARVVATAGRAAPWLALAGLAGVGLLVAARGGPRRMAA